MHALEPLLLEQAAPARASRAAICVHGRAIDEVVTQSLIEGWQPLDADIFATLASDAAVVSGQRVLPSTDVPQDSRHWLNSTGRLVHFEKAPDSNEADSQQAIGRGFWGLVGMFAIRSYRDLSNHIRCNEIVRAHEKRAGVRYSIIGHCRADMRIVAPLPRAIAESWRIRAEAEAETPHVFVPAAPPYDIQGFLDVSAVGNRRGWEAVVGVRDNVTAGLSPINWNCHMRQLQLRSVGVQSVTKSRCEACNCGPCCGHLTPEWFSAAHFNETGAAANGCGV